MKYINNINSHKVSCRTYFVNSPLKLTIFELKNISIVVNYKINKIQIPSLFEIIDLS